MSEEIIIVPHSESLITAFGACDRHIRRISDALGVRIWTHKREIHVSGDSSAVQKAQAVVRQLLVRPFVSDDDVSCLVNEAQYRETPYIEPPYSEVGPDFSGSGRRNDDFAVVSKLLSKDSIVSDLPNTHNTPKEMQNAQDNNSSISGPAFSSPASEGSQPSIWESNRRASRSGNENANIANISDLDSSPIEVKPLDVFTGRKIRPRTAGQARFLRALQNNELTFCSGPAGSGKTYLAVAAAVAAMKAGTVERIMLVRPAVEAGESLGFLPGDLRAKINPYLRPLFDALRDMMDPMSIKRLTEEDIIEVIPLAYMRGRTFNSAYIILDEAQNTTVSQMKMFLTRMGENSRVVVSGDVTQIDLPPRTESGLVDALKRLKGIRNIAMVEMTAADIVRHRLVQRIVNAYEGIQ